MEFSIAALLANFIDDKLVAPKVLEKKLECNDEASLRKLQIALDALEKIGILEKDRGRYRRITEEGVIEGKLRCSSKGFCFAIQDVEGSEDIYIRESQLSNAWNGDRVLVRITKEGNRKRSPEGEVRLIVERSNPAVLARVRRTETNFRAMPLDDRLLFELELQPNGVDPEAAIEQLAHIEVLRYPLGQNPPIGRLVKILGADSDASDIDIVCCKHYLLRTFPDSVLEAATQIAGAIDQSELQNRLDLRHITTLTIKAGDTESTDSLDDAISLEQLGEHWRLGIHIADVARYVATDSAIDREAKRRGASVYLGDLVVPMLPDAIAKDFCAFLPGHDRLAVSVLVTLTTAGEVVEYEIQPTVIQVDHSLSYQQAQAILDRFPGTPDQEAIQTFASIFSLLDQLAALSHALKEQRRRRGAFELNLPEKPSTSHENLSAANISKLFTPKFHYDDEGALSAMVISPSEPTHTMIVEWMLLANQLVAEHLQALGVPGIYRVHPTPDPEDVQELMKLVINMGIELHLEQEDTVRPQDYQQFTQKFAESDAERVLTYLLLETFKPAFYSTTSRSHFGLALEQGYTHFTSPVRRYPDLLIQRVLHAVFAEGRDRKSSRSKEVVNLRHSSSHDNISWNVLPPEIQQEFETMFSAIVVHLSEREKVALEAEQDLEGLKKAELMRERTGEIFHGLITGVQSYGLFVELEELLVEGLVHVSSLKDDWYEYRSRQQTLVGRKNRKQYRLGDRIEVQVKSVDYYRQQIDLISIGGGVEVAEDVAYSETESPYHEQTAASYDSTDAARRFEEISATIPDYEPMGTIAYGNVTETPPPKRVIEPIQRPIAADFSIDPASAVSSNFVEPLPDPFEPDPFEPDPSGIDVDDEWVETPLDDVPESNAPESNTATDLADLQIAIPYEQVAVDRLNHVESDQPEQWDQQDEEDAIAPVDDLIAAIPGVEDPEVGDSVPADAVADEGEEPAAEQAIADVPLNPVAMETAAEETAADDRPNTIHSSDTTEDTTDFTSPNSEATAVPDDGLTALEGINVNANPVFDSVVPDFVDDDRSTETDAETSFAPNAMPNLAEDLGATTLTNGITESLPTEEIAATSMLDQPAEPTNLDERTDQDEPASDRGSLAPTISPEPLEPID